MKNTSRILAAVAICLTSALPAAADVPRFFALLNPGQDARGLAGEEGISGLAWRGAWRFIESRDDAFDWSSLDQTLKEARSEGKPVAIHVGVSKGALPTWLVGKVETYELKIRSSSRSTLEVVPWDRVFLEEYGEMIDSLGQHLEAGGWREDVEMVSVGGPVSEMSLLGCMFSRDGSIRTNGKLGDIPYQRDAYLSAWKYAVAMHAAALGDIPMAISAPRETICWPDKDGAAFFDDVMSWAMGMNDDVRLFAADLTAIGSDRFDVGHRALRTGEGVAFQTIWSVNEDPRGRMKGSFGSTVCAAVARGADYMEVYQADFPFVSRGRMDSLSCR